MFELLGTQLLSYIFSFSATREGEEDMDRETSKYVNEEYKKVIIMENNTFMMPPIAVAFNDTFNKLLDAAKSSNIPSTKNQRVFEVAKELVVHGSHVSSAVSVARQLVDEVGVEME